jgi:hypothetical protein
MRNFFRTVSVLIAVVSLSCHKSASSPVLSGKYVENSPEAGATTLNFVSANTVTVSGTSFFLEPLSAPLTLNYFLSSASNGPIISFVMINSGAKDTLSCNYVLSGNADLELSFKPCPPGVPCNALGGTDFMFRK